MRTIDINSITGFHIWQSFTTVVKLTENMRHSHDPSYGEILQRLRTGDQTIEDFKVLNSRYLDPFDPKADVHKQFNIQREGVYSFPIAVQGNKSRHSINWLSACEIFSGVPTLDIPIMCPAIFSPAKRGTKPTAEQLKNLLQLGDNKLKRLSPLRPVFPGMPCVHYSEYCT